MQTLENANILAVAAADVALSKYIEALAFEDAAISVYETIGSIESETTYLTALKDTESAYKIFAKLAGFVSDAAAALAANPDTDRSIVAAYQAAFTAADNAWFYSDDLPIDSKGE